MQQEVISRDQEVLGGTPVVAHTRVPIQTLLDYLAGGQSLHEFLDDFPTVDHDQAVAVLEQRKHLVLAEPALHEGTITDGDRTGHPRVG